MRLFCWSTNQFCLGEKKKKMSGTLIKVWLCGWLRGVNAVNINQTEKSGRHHAFDSKIQVKFVVKFGIMQRWKAQIPSGKRSMEFPRTPGSVQTTAPLSSPFMGLPEFGNVMHFIILCQQSIFVKNNLIWGQKEWIELCHQGLGAAQISVFSYCLTFRRQRGLIKQQLNSFKKNGRQLEI